MVKAIVKYHVIHHVVLNSAEKIAIVFLISIHTNTLSAIAMKMKMRIKRIQINEN